MVFPLVSIVTVAYNAISTIEQTILSVINQTYPNIEYIIIDGGSTDGTVEIIKKYSDKITYWVSEPDKGIYNAMNKGIMKATGEWINFMNAGDTFYDDRVIENIDFNTIDKFLVKVVYGDTVKKNNSGQSYLKAKSLNELSRRIICCHQSIFISLLDKEDVLFNEDYIISSDYDLLCRLKKKYGIFSFLYRSMPFSVFDGLGLSSTNRLLLFREQLAIRNRNIVWYLDWIRFMIRCILHKFYF